MSFDISGILGNIFQGAIDAAKEVAQKMIKEATADATEFVSAILPALGRYVELLASKQITIEEFKSLMMGLKDLGQMAALSQAGLAEIEVDKTRNAILKAVTGIALGAVSKLV